MQIANQIPWKEISLTIFIVIILFAFSVTSSFAIGLQGIKNFDEPYASTSISYFFINVTLIAPVLETPMVMLFMPATARKPWLHAALCGSVIGGFHVVILGLSAIGAVVFFFANSLIFHHWRSRFGVGYGFLAAYIAHALHNGMVAAGTYIYAL